MQIDEGQLQEIKEIALSFNLAEDKLPGLLKLIVNMGIGSFCGDLTPEEQEEYIEEL